MLEPPLTPRVCVMRGRVLPFFPVMPHHLSVRDSGRVAAPSQAVELTSQPLTRPAGVARPLHPGRRRVGGRWWTAVDVAHEGDRCADPRLDHLDDLDIPLALGDVCLDAIADPDLGGRLRVPTVDLDMTGVAELRRDRARLDEPRRGQPSVDPCLIQHPPTLPARAPAAGGGPADGWRDQGSGAIGRRRGPEGRDGDLLVETDSLHRIARGQGDRAGPANYLGPPLAP